MNSLEAQQRAEQIVATFLRSYYYPEITRTFAAGEIIPPELQVIYEGIPLRYRKVKWTGRTVTYAPIPLQEAPDAD